MLLNSNPNTVYTLQTYPLPRTRSATEAFSIPPNGQTITGQGSDNNKLLVSNNGEFYISILSEPPTNQFSSLGRGVWASRDQSVT